MIDKERVRKYGEVFTPQWCVDLMCDELEKQNPNAWEPDRTFLEPSCGEGVFVCEVLRRKFQRCRTRGDYTTAIGSVYAFDILEDNVAKTIRNVTDLCGAYFTLSIREKDMIKNHIIQADALKVMRMWQDPAINEYLTERGDHGA